MTSVSASGRTRCARATARITQTPRVGAAGVNAAALNVRWTDLVPQHAQRSLATQIPKQESYAAHIQLANCMGREQMEIRGFAGEMET